MSLFWGRWVLSSSSKLTTLELCIVIFTHIPAVLLQWQLSQCSVGSFHILEQNSTFAWAEKWHVRQETTKCRTFCEKTSEGTACSSITDTQHVFGWSLHPPDFVTVSKTAKSVSYCNYSIGGGKEAKKNIVQRFRLEVLISYQTHNLPSPIFLPMPMHF